MFLVRMKMSPLLLKTLYYLRSCYQLTRHGDDEMWMTNDSQRDRRMDVGFVMSGGGVGVVVFALVLIGRRKSKKVF